VTFSKMDELWASTSRAAREDEDEAFRFSFLFFFSLGAGMWALFRSFEVGVWSPPFYISMNKSFFLYIYSS